MQQNFTFPVFDNDNSSSLHQKIKELRDKETESEIFKENKEENSERVKYF